MHHTSATGKLNVELIYDPDLKAYTARVADIPAYGEGPTEEAAIADLKEALRGYIEAFGIEDALARLQSPIIVRSMHFELADLTD